MYLIFSTMNCTKGRPMLSIVPFKKLSKNADWGNITVTLISHQYVEFNLKILIYTEFYLRYIFMA